MTGSFPADFCTLAEAIPDAVFILNTVSEGLAVVQVNERACEILGCTRDAFTNSFIERHLTQDSYQRLFAWLEKLTVVSGWQRTRMDKPLNLQKHDNISISVDATVAPISYGDDTFICCIFREKPSATMDEPWLSDVLENSVSEVFLIDPADLTILHANRAAITNLGYTLDEIRSMTVPDIATQFTLESAVEQWPALADGQMHSAVSVRKDKTTYVFEAQLQLTQYRGRPTHLLMGMDVSSSTTKIASLRYADRSMDAATAGFVITDPTQPNNPIVYANRAAVEMWGYSADELLGKSPTLFHGEDADPDELAGIAAALRERREFRTTLKHYSKQGKLFYVDLTVTPVFDDAGELTHTFGIQRDITTEYKTELTLQARNEVLEMMVSDKPLNDILTTLAKSIESLEPDVKASIGLYDEIKQVLHFEVAPSLPEFYLQAINGLQVADNAGACGTAAFRKQTVICEDLQTDPAWTDYRSLVAEAGLGACWSQPILASLGDLLGTVGFYFDSPCKPNNEQLSWTRDIAVLAAIAIERDRMTKERLRYADELESTVVQRTREATRANRSKSRFLAAASHDLRQPLQSLGLYAKALGNAEAETPQPDVINKLELSIDVMRELLDALQDVADIETGVVVPNITEFPIQNVLDKLRVSAEPQVQEKGLSIVIDPSSLLVRSDPKLLFRILENLLSNAIRYTSTGTLSVVSESTGTTLQLKVVDTGMGIPADSLACIFDEYYQLNNPSRDRRKGTGLGLTIVKMLAELLEHQIDVQSTVGVGTTFTITLPVALGLGQSIMDDGIPMEREEAYLAERKCATVLLVDDDDAIVDAMTMVLESESIGVQAASSAEEALNMLRQGLQPTFLVSDYRLPGTTGVDVVQQVRALTCSELPAVLMTGDSTNETIAEADLSNCQIMQKPVDIDRLLGLIYQSVARTDSTEFDKGSEPHVMED